MQNPTMGCLVVAGLQELRTLFGTYEQFVTLLWNVFHKLLIFVDLYGTAPRWVPSFCFFTVASLFITSRLWIKIIRPMSSLFILIRKTSFAGSFDHHRFIFSDTRQF